MAEEETWGSQEGREEVILEGEQNIIYALNKQEGRPAFPLKGTHRICGESSV